MKEYILSWKQLSTMFFFAFIATCIFFMGAIISLIETDKRDSKAVEKECSFRAWSEDRGDIRLNLDCDGVAVWTEDAETILAYLETPGPMICSRQYSGKGDCSLIDK